MAKMWCSKEMGYFYGWGGGEGRGIFKGIETFSRGVKVLSLGM